MKTTITKKKSSTKKYAMAFRTLCVLILMLGIASCNNDDDAPKQENIRIKSYSKDANEYNLTYNENNRLASIGSREILYGTEGRVLQIGTTKYTNNNQGWVTKRILWPTSNYPQTETFEYDNEGLMKNSKWSSSNQTDYSTFFYDSENRLASIIVKYKTPRSDFKYSLTYDANDNIEQILVERSKDGGVTYPETSVTNYTYDTKKNPLYLLINKDNSNLNEIHIMYSGLLINYVSLENNAPYSYSKNNMLSSERIDNNGTTTTRTYNYIYDKNNYPISAEIKDTVRGTEYRTWTYEEY